MFFLLLYFFIWVLYALWSFTLVDPNIVFTSLPLYVQLQNFLWSIDKKIVTICFVLLSIGLLSVYSLIIHRALTFTKEKKSSSSSKIILLFGACLVVLTLSYNALSHDVFNYLFNARMVLRYQTDPHIFTALEFASRDDWVRFMHNIHTPAPYWYGWTAISLIPSMFGFGKFTLTWILFKLWSALGFAALIFALRKIAQQLNSSIAQRWVWVIALHPLLLIEFASNAHNDGWMMASAVASIAVLFLMKPTDSLQKKTVCIMSSLILLAFSISMKYVTVLLLPLWFICLVDQLNRHVPKSLEQLWQIVREYQWDLTTILLLIPLLTARSQQFHPWYVLWAFSFLPFVRRKEIRTLLIGLSISSLFRYVPWLWAGAFEFTPLIQLHQKLITWAAVPIVGVWMIYQKFKIKD